MTVFKEDFNQLEHLNLFLKANDDGIQGRL
jgi:hypothetical protein